MDGLHKLENALLAATSDDVNQLVAPVLDDASVLFISRNATADCLRAAEVMLGFARSRVLRVRPSLELADFVEQVASASPASGQNALERTFETLTELDASCDRVVLMVEDAHLTPHPTLRYIEMALRAGPHLQVVLAGQAALVDTLALPGFASLRQRLSVRLDAPEPVSHPIPASVAAAPVARQRWHTAVLAGALAASVALVAGAQLLQKVQALPPVAVAHVPPAPARAAEVPGTAPDTALAEAGLPAPPPTEPPAAQSPEPIVSATPVVESASPVAVAAVPETSAPLLPNLAPPDPVPPVRPAPSGLPASPPRHAAARPTPARPERVASLTPTSVTNERRCRDIVLRAQLGESPQDGDRVFLRNGCR